MSRLETPIRKNDNVVVTTGKDRGKRGRVLIDGHLLNGAVSPAFRGPTIHNAYSTRRAHVSSFRNRGEAYTRANRGWREAPRGRQRPPGPVTSG